MSPFFGHEYRIFETAIFNFVAELDQFFHNGGSASPALLEAETITHLDVETAY